jgi:surface polysaccharide O-acyltransferase-like enzyme
MTIKRNLSIDILKFIMSFLIVGLHGKIFEDISNPLYYFVVSGITRIAVPIFLIVTGFYFYEVNMKENFKKWIKRLFYLYIIWTIIYYYWVFLPYKAMIISIFFGYYHLWYIIGSLYALILVWLIHNWGTTKQVCLLISCALLGILIQYIGNYSFEKLFYLIGPYIYRNGLFICFPFILIGYLINKFSFHKKIRRRVPLLIIGFLLMLSEIYVNFLYNGKIFEILISLYFFCPILFIYVLNKPLCSKSKTLSLYSTGIYLVHNLVFLHINKLISLNNTLNVIIVFFISTFFTFFIIKVQKRFRYIL